MARTPKPPSRPRPLGDRRALSVTVGETAGPPPGRTRWEVFYPQTWREMGIEDPRATEPEGPDEAADGDVEPDGGWPLPF